MRWVAHMDRVFLSTQSLSRTALLRDLGLFGDRYFAESYPQPRQVVRSMQLPVSGASESQPSSARVLSHSLVDCMQNGMLDGARWCARKI